MAFPLRTAKGAGIGASEHDKPVSVSWRVYPSGEGRGLQILLDPSFNEAWPVPKLNRPVTDKELSPIASASSAQTKGPNPIRRPSRPKV
jgi:hypothetical protein